MKSLALKVNTAGREGQTNLNTKNNPPKFACLTIEYLKSLFEEFPASSCT